MKSLTYPLTIPELVRFNHGNADIATFLHAFFAPGSSNYRQLAYELQLEFKQGGSPDVTRIAFDRASYNAQTGKGIFRVVLDINFTFGCEDVITKKQDETSEWTFAVDFLNSTINFYSSPFAEARSTADEF